MERLLFSGYFLNIGLFFFSFEIKFEFEIKCFLLLLYFFFICEMFIEDIVYKIRIIVL